jgi:FHS family L-fucose permease-like MFS transporter
MTISGWILGFRVTFMTGLTVLAIGCLLIWPSGVKRSFGGFCGSMFVVGAGLSTLETAADAFLSICGPPRYSEIRLNLVQAVQGCGSFVAPLLGSRAFFAHTVNNSQGLKNVQWTCLVVACFVGLLLILFVLAPMPEITDADMGTQEVEIAEYDPGPFRKQDNFFLLYGRSSAMWVRRSPSLDIPSISAKGMLSLSDFASFGQVIPFLPFPSDPVIKLTRLIY